MSSKQKIVIRLGVPNDKNRSKALQLASKLAGVNSVAITGEAKDRLEVVAESIDSDYLIKRLCKKVCRADIVVVEEVKDKKKEEEEKKNKKKEEEEAKKKKAAEEDKKKAAEAKKAAAEDKKEPWAAYHQPLYPGPPPTFLWEEQQPEGEGCHIM